MLSKLWKLLKECFASKPINNNIDKEIDNLVDEFVNEIFPKEKPLMGLFGGAKTEKEPAREVPTVPDEEKKYYQDDEYYQSVLHEGTPFEKRVVFFEDRKKTAIPSNRGLYPAEILLLSYCSKGTYPRPEKGYPGFWWFEYGIRDVTAALKTLEERGYIFFGNIKDSLRGLTVAQLKELLLSQSQSTAGKKADLIARAINTIPEEALIKAGITPKYRLTEIGRQELEENAYVPYMHSFPHKTIELEREDENFNVWSINKLLGKGDKSNWKTVVGDQESKVNATTAARNEAFMNSLKKTDPKGYKILKAQDQQLKAINEAYDKFRKDKDLESYIKFWEKIWQRGGLKFEGVRWCFELPNLYIKAKRYDEALALCYKILETKSTYYANKANSLIYKIEILKAKGKK